MIECSDRRSTAAFRRLATSSAFRDKKSIITLTGNNALCTLQSAEFDSRSLSLVAKVVIIFRLPSLLSIFALSLRGQDILMKVFSL